jgi:hypothetical protein
MAELRRDRVTRVVAAALGSSGGELLTTGPAKAKRLDRQLRREYAHNIPQPRSAEFIADLAVTTAGLFVAYPDLGWIEEGKRGVGRVFGWRWADITGVDLERGWWRFSGLRIGFYSGVLGYAGLGHPVVSDLSGELSVRSDRAVAGEAVKQATHG